MARVIFYWALAMVLIIALPTPGSIKYANPVVEYLWLPDNTIAVTLPWQGILMKKGIIGDLRATIIDHENCHVKQIQEFGAFGFMWKYYKNPGHYEDECYSNKMFKPVDTVSS